jgi:peptidyl-prolyl cis-trans isomerase A (cyclophilin A)
MSLIIRSLRAHSRVLAAASTLAACALVAIAAVAQTESAPSQEPKSPASPTQVVFVLITTSKGEIVVELNREKAPISVGNFLTYAEKKHYDGTIFHRVMRDFMIQGGGFTPDMVQKPVDPPIKNEWRNGLKNNRGSLAMARVGGNPDSATSQFFINVVDNPRLDQPQNDGAAYAVFGKVVAGMSVVDAIRVVPTATRGMHQNVPTENVVIQTVRRIDPADAKKRIDADQPKKTEG